MTAEELWNTWGCRVPLTGEWEGEEVDNIFQRAMEFMGWYISEGWSKKCKNTGTKTTIGIGQSRSKSRKIKKELKGFLDRLGFSWSYTANGMAYYVGVRSMPQGLREMCSSLGVAEEKIYSN